MCFAKVNHRPDAVIRPLKNDDRHYALHYGAGFLGWVVRAGTVGKCPQLNLGVFRQRPK